MNTFIKNSLILLAFFAAFSTTHAATIVWTNTAGGDWNEVTNWSPNVVPGSGDTVEVTNDASFTVNVDGLANAGSIFLGTTDLDSTNTQVLQVTEGNTFILSGMAAVSTNGQFNLGTGSVLIGTNATLAGVLNGSATTLSGTLTILTNGVLNVNPPGMTFNGFPNLQVVTNYGTVNWNATSAYEDNGGVIFNYGLWVAQTDGTFYGRSSSGNGTFENYGTFSKLDGTNTTLFDPNGTFNNYGEVNIQTGTFDVGSGQDNGSFTNASGTLLTFGQFILTGTNSFTGEGVLTNSFLVGSNAVVEGSLVCAGQLTIGGTLTIDGGATLQLLTSATFDGFVNGGYLPALFTNKGTVVWSSNDQFGDNSPQIDNYGLWSAQSDNTFFGTQNSGTTTFNNFGEFQKAGTSGTTTVDGNTIFNNLGGTVQTASGTVRVQTGKGGGTFDTVGGSHLDLTSFNFSGNSTFADAGVISGLLTSTNAIFHGIPDFSDVTFSGVFTLADDCNMSVGTGGIDFNGFPNATTVTNYGTVTWATGSLFGDNSPTIINYGTWYLATDGLFSGHASSGNTTFDNLGTVRKTAGSGGSTSFTAFQFNNAGLLDVQTGEVMLASSYALGGGTLNFGINSATNFGNIHFSGSVALGGTLSANLNNLFTPAISNSFAVITYDAKTGGFTNFNLPSGNVWTNTYTGTASILSVILGNPPQITTAPGVQNGTFSFSFTGEPGQTYQIQATTNLFPVNWVNVGPPIYVSNTIPITVSNLISVDPQLFYQLILE